MALATFFYFLKNSYEILNNTQVKNEKSLKIAQTKILRQKFNPHFLFNTFNIIYYMSSISDPKTSDTILKVSNIMKYLKSEINDPKIKLSKEILFLNEYIEIGKLRFGDRVNINFKVLGNIENTYIEPLIFINFIENAFKHGSFKSHAFSYIFIRLEVTLNNTILFTVKNTIAPNFKQKDDQRESTGINQLKKRLNLIYPNKHVISFKNIQQEYYFASLELFQ